MKRVLSFWIYKLRNCSYNYTQLILNFSFPISNRKKHYNLLVDKIRKKENHLNELTGEYQKLLAYKTEKPSVERPPETQEEDQNRKVII